MGQLFIGSSTKGFTGMTATSVSKSTVESIDKEELSPALAKLVEALKANNSEDGPIEIVIGIFGKERHVFSVEVEDLSEIQEILQWTVGR